MNSIIKSLVFMSTVTLFTPYAFADPHDWRVSVQCDSLKREAKVEIERCDYEISCDPKEVQTLNNGKSIIIGTDASRQRYTDHDDEFTFIKNNPEEYSCVFDTIDSSKFKIAEPSVFIRIERFPTNWNVQGRCGAAPNQVTALVQAHSSSLDMKRPFQVITMVGDCDWGVEGPISKVVVKADSGEISQFKFLGD